MPLRIVASFALVLLALPGTTAAQLPATGAPGNPDLAGVWELNPALTQRPQEIGFSRDWAQAGQGEEGSGRRGGRGRRAGTESAIGAPRMSHESADDSTRMDQLTDQARTPPGHLTIVQKPESVSIADDQGRSRTFHPDGKQEDLSVGTVPLPTTARWSAGSLIVVYDVETGRQLRYTYTPSANPRRLLVDIRFLEQGREGDEVKLTYEPPDAHNAALLSGSPAPAAPTAPGTSAAPTGAMVPADAGARTPVLPPGSELRGLTTIGTEVEELTPEGAACGLDRTKIKTSVARILANAGFKTRPDHDEDSYVLLSVVTSKLPDGTCVSRYDASLVAQADATFPYLEGLVAVPVQLLHEGGMAGGAPASHATAVMNALTKSVDTFVSQLRAAGK